MSPIEIKRQRELTDGVYEEIIRLSATGEMITYANAYPEFPALCRHYLQCIGNMPDSMIQCLKQHIVFLIDKVNEGPRV